MATGLILKSLTWKIFNRENGHFLMETSFRQLQRGVIFLTVIFIAFFPASSQTGEIFYVGKFSDASPGDKLPAGWNPLTFNKIKSHTSYAMVKDGDASVIKAVSKASASGLTRKIRIDPEKYPIVQWRWKVVNIYRNGDVTKKDGDDYPARIYITFEYNPKKVSIVEKAKFKFAKLVYGEYPPSGAITYIWASKAQVGTIVSNPYTDRVKMIVVESGEDALNSWITEERSIFDDYFTAFGAKPPMISGIAIMTDSDNTKESAIAFYGDILFKQK